MTDEHLLTAAKLAEQVRGRIDGDSRLLDHTGLVSDAQDRAALSFIETSDLSDLDLGGDLPPTSFSQTSLGRICQSKFLTDEATSAVHSGNSMALSSFVGVTEQDLDASALRLPLLLLDRLDNHGAPAFVLGAGNPNTGKTNTMSLLAELRKAAIDDLLILSNSRSWDYTDVVTTSAHDLLVALLEHRDRPKFVMLDEASTAFDSRTNRSEVAYQWTPLAKRMAKIGVDTCGFVTHTGKDVHPEVKRMTTLAYFKTQKDVAEFYSEWPADADFPTDRLFGGPLENLEPTTVEYDPDDAAPWSWNLESDLFSLDLDWPQLLDELRSRGPAT